MVRRHRSPAIQRYHLVRIERQAALLDACMRGGLMSLQPSSPHYDALLELCRAMRTALNLLNDRPADYVEPHRAPFSGAPGPEST